MLKTRKYQLTLAQQDILFGRIPAKQFYLWDRSMIGDYVFALWNHLLGGISKQEMDVYENEFGGSIKEPEKLSFLAEVSCYVLLNDEPSQCKNRVENHRGNESESSIPLAYYEGIDDIHFDIFVRRLMPKKISKVLTLTWGQYDSEEVLWTMLNRVVTGNLIPSSVFYVTKEEMNNLSLDSPCIHIYRSEKDILHSYLLLQDMKFNSSTCSENINVFTNPLISSIYIPINIMNIPEKEKHLVDNDFNVLFYQNEYKRVTLAHLSKLQDVYFY